MDKLIKKLQSKTKSLAKEESNLLKKDKARDKICDYGKKAMEKIKKKK
ncbi:MAG: hypothetical protein ABFD00_10555 [Chloroherpetonaceae bacterium]